jgi:hypothetical protein
MTSDINQPVINEITKLVTNIPTSKNKTPIF